MTQPFRRSRRETDRDQEILLRIRERLEQIKRRLTLVDALRTTDKAVTLHEFTEKHLNGKRLADFSMLQMEIYDATAKSRAVVK